MKKIIFVAHCILNTASKVQLYNEPEIIREEELRVKFIKKSLEKGICLVQLPCPEQLMYGCKRWGHVYEQFDNEFFKSRCREMLTPIVMQINEYVANSDRFSVIGVVGIDGSPSCGVDYTCSGGWYGSFEARQDLEQTLNSVTLVSANGVFINVLSSMLLENNIEIPITGLYANEPHKILDLINRKI